MVDEVSVANLRQTGSELSENELDEGVPLGCERHHWHRPRSAAVKSYVHAFCGLGDTLLEIGTTQRGITLTSCASLDSTRTTAIRTIHGSTRRQGDVCLSED